MRKHVKMQQFRRYTDFLMKFFFIVGLCCAFIIMFSYADNFSQNKRQLFYHLRGRKQDNNFSVQKYTWDCKNSQCVKTLSSKSNRTSLTTCQMLCSTPQIWPKPRNLQISNRQISTIDITKITFNIPNHKLLINASDIFIKKIESLKLAKNQTAKEGIRLKIKITILSQEIVKLSLKTDESYNLVLKKEEEEIFAGISAPNFFGARHALETLSQLIWFDEFSGFFLILHDIDIRDSPQFSYRGLMVDTARNFFPVNQLLRIIDGMAMAKLNILHLHLTDAVSFPIILPSIKELAEFGAYGPDMVYTPQDIKEMIEYGLVRGVRLLLEIDAPTHVNAGWNYAEELFNEKYVICGENDILNGHLNPDNINVLTALESIYKDLIEMSGETELFHIGSDEVNLDCWQTTNAAKNYEDMTKFWASFTNLMLDKLKSANNEKFPDNIIMWSSPLTESSHFKKIQGNITVQFWLGDPRKLLRSGAAIIYSTVGHWYLDCGFGPWRPSMENGVCDPYTPWQTFYKYMPWELFGYRNQALGGEVCLWSEQVEIDSLETRIWPRSAAFAERVWTDPLVFDEYDVYTRLNSFRERLVAKGLKAAAMWPRWCSQNPGRC